MVELLPRHIFAAPHLQRGALALEVSLIALTQDVARAFDFQFGEEWRDFSSRQMRLIMQLGKVDLCFLANCIVVDALLRLDCLQLVLGGLPAGVQSCSTYRVVVVIAVIVRLLRVPAVQRQKQLLLLLCGGHLLNLVPSVPLRILVTEKLQNIVVKGVFCMDIWRDQIDVRGTIELRASMMMLVVSLDSRHDKHFLEAAIWTA